MRTSKSRKKHVVKISCNKVYNEAFLSPQHNCLFSKDRTVKSSHTALCTLKYFSSGLAERFNTYCTTLSYNPSIGQLSNALMYSQRVLLVKFSCKPKGVGTLLL